MLYAFPYIDHLSLFECFLSSVPHYLHVSDLILFLNAFVLPGTVVWRTDWHKTRLRKATTCLTSSLWVQGGTVKPALTQPWGLRDVPGHLIWALRWLLESLWFSLCLSTQVVNPQVVLEYILPVIFCLSHLCFFDYVCLKDEQVADILITYKCFRSFSP